jgi:Trk-type K+ transport system membrane component
VSIVNLQLINPALLVSYMIMMYISVYPIAMSIRNTNVYEEKSLGIYSEEDHEDHHSHLGETRFHVV